MATLPVKDKTLVETLYHSQAKGTEKLYLDVGYFMWMVFWDTIKHDDVVKAILTANSDSECKKIYEYFVDLMNVYIANRERKVSTENVNNMIYSRNSIMASYKDNPSLFLAKMKFNLHQELRIVNIHDGNDVDEDFIDLEGEESVEDSQDLSDVSNSFLNTDQEIKAETCTSLSTYNTNQIFNTDFLSDLEAAYELLDKQRKQMTDMINFSGQMEQSNFWEVLKMSLDSLEKILMKYRSCQTMVEVKLQPKVKQEEALKFVFNGYARILSKCYSNISSLGVKEEINLFMDMSLAVTEHPKCFVLVQSEGGGRRGGKNVQEGNPSQTGKEKNSAAKESRKYNTKKKASISVTVEILGFKFLPEVFIDSYNVTLVTEDGQECGDLNVPKPDIKESQLAFSDITVQKHQRKGSGNVRHQFVRLLINVKVQCFDDVFELKAKTLPFYLCTGALQELELIGMRMWYCASNTDMYGQCVFHKELNTKEFLDMLDMRIKSVCGDRERGLSNDARQFIVSRIQDQTGSKSNDRKMISEHSFVKAKLIKFDESEKSFSFFTWFYALVNTIETHLLHHWCNGVIYDLMTKEEARQVLLNEEVPFYTALIRPSNSYVKKPNCTEALVKLVVEIKIQTEDGAESIEGVHIAMKNVKQQGFYKVLQKIEFEDGDSSVIKHIITRNGIIPFEKYAHSCENEFFEKHYETVVRKFTGLKLQNPKSSGCPPKKISKSNSETITPTVLKHKTSKRRRSYSSISVGDSSVASDVLFSPSPMCELSPMSQASPLSGYMSEEVAPVTPNASALLSSPASSLFYDNQDHSTHADLVSSNETMTPLPMIDISTKFSEMKKDVRLQPISVDTDIKNQMELNGTHSNIFPMSSYRNNAIIDQNEITDIQNMVEEFKALEKSLVKT